MVDDKILNLIKKRHPNKLLVKMKETPRYYIYIVSNLDGSKNSGLNVNAIDKTNNTFTTLDFIMDYDEISKSVDIPNIGFFDKKVI